MACHMCGLLYILVVVGASQGLKLDENSTTSRIWSHIKSQGGGIVLERPSEGGPPDEVRLTMSVSSVRGLDEVKMEVTFDLYLIQQWQDSRVAYDDGRDRIALPMSIAKGRMWMPDLFIINVHELTTHETIDQLSAVFIQKNGEIMVSSKISVALHCDMHLRSFPHDEHTCSMELESYMFAAQDLLIVIGDVRFSSRIHLPGFKFKFSNKSIQIEELSFGSYQRAVVYVTLTRTGHHVTILLYTPSIVLVLLSMLLYWMPIGALMERSLYGIVLLFSMTTILVGSQYGAPQVGYVKALDIWVAGCWVFIATALLEVVGLNLLFGRELARCGDQFELMHDESSAETTPVGVKLGPWLIRPDVAHRIDLAFKIIYPACFILFCAVYWGVWSS